jgi:hypothetical protein
MEIGLIFTVIGTAVATLATIYTFLRNFKIDINSHIDRVESQMKEDSQKRDKRFS